MAANDERTDQVRTGAERGLLWLFLLLLVLTWGGLGGLIFVGILQDAAGA